MIDEKKLIEDLKEYAHLSEGDSVDTIQVIIKIVGEQPKVGEWIPCSVALPQQPEENPIFDNKPLELYLVSVKNADYPIRAFWNGKFFTDGWSKVDVIAWQPLPQPYQPKGE